MNPSGVKRCYLLGVGLLRGHIEARCLNSSVNMPECIYNWGVLVCICVFAMLNC